MTRLRLLDVRISRLAKAVGLCQGDLAALAELVNSAQRRLLMCKETCDEGWWGTWAEMAFTVTNTNPYITTPRGVARAEAFNVCSSPTPINNQFYEYLQFGNGTMPSRFPRDSQGILQSYSRNNAVTFTEMTNAPQYLRVYCVDAADTDSGARVLFQGLDANGNVIRTQDGAVTVEGAYVTLASPFATTDMTFSRLTGIQKDETVGDILIYQVDPNDATEVQLSRMEPSELTASYRRYFFHPCPTSCCFNPGDSSTVTVTAIVKLDLIPVQVDTDYLLIQNLEAIIEECQAIRYSTMDIPSAKLMAQEKHLQAIRFLNGELVHHLGNEAAVEFKPFGSARLERQQIGTLL